MRIMKSLSVSLARGQAYEYEGDRYCLAVATAHKYRVFFFRIRPLASVTSQSTTRVLCVIVFVPI